MIIAVYRGKEDAKLSSVHGRKSGEQKALFLLGRGESRRSLPGCGSCQKLALVWGSRSIVIKPNLFLLLLQDNLISKVCPLLLSQDNLISKVCFLLLLQDNPISKIKRKVWCLCARLEGSRPIKRTAFSLHVELDTTNQQVSVPRRHR